MLGSFSGFPTSCANKFILSLGASFIPFCTMISCWQLHMVCCLVALVHVFIVKSLLVSKV
jgi:hypothetical protein